MSANPDDATPGTIFTPRASVERGDPQKFTGDVVVERLGEADVKVLRVSFGVGARTAVHRHSSAQWLYFLEGRGFVQQIDSRNQGPVRRPQAGEAVVTPEGVWHHHGALDGFHAVHLSITRAGPDDDANWRLGDFHPAVPPAAVESE